MPILFLTYQVKSIKETINFLRFPAYPYKKSNLKISLTLTLCSKSKINLLGNRYLKNESSINVSNIQCRKFKSVWVYIYIYIYIYKYINIAHQKNDYV